MENKDLCGRHLYHLYECMNRYQLEVQMILMREDMTLMVQKKKKGLESFIIQLFALLLTIVGGRRLAKAAANRFSESHEFIHLHLSPTWIGLMGKWVSLGLWPFYFYFFLLLLFVCSLFFKCTPVCHAKATPIFIIFLVFPTFDAKDSFSKFYF